MPGLAASSYELDGDDLHRKVRVAFIDMNRDLRAERSQVVSELRAILADE